MGKGIWHFTMSLDGFIAGPGDDRPVHMRDERCEVSQIVEACAFYTRVINRSV